MKPKKSLGLRASSTYNRKQQSESINSNLASDFKRQDKRSTTGAGFNETAEKLSLPSSTRPNSSSRAHTCSGCNKSIKREKYLLSACDKFWHEGCLKCDQCHAKLGELGSSLFVKSDLILCRQDFLDLFGPSCVCSVCEKLIRASEMVMRAQHNVYHLECFACQLCSQRFCVGDQFYLLENKVICQYDYEDIQRSMMANHSTSPMGLSFESTNIVVEEDPNSGEQSIHFQEDEPESILQELTTTRTMAASRHCNARHSIQARGQAEQEPEGGESDEIALLAAGKLVDLAAVAAAAAGLTRPSCEIAPVNELD